MFGVLGSSQVDAKSESTVGAIKSRVASALLLAKAKALYAFSILREPNAVLIKRSFDAKDVIAKYSELLNLGVDGEAGLLLNIQALGFDKKNALSALKIVDQCYRAMHSVEQRHASAFALWNKTPEMDVAIAAILPYLRVSKLYLLYFQNHQDCLRGWELVGRSVGTNLTNAQSAICTVLQWYKNSNAFNILKCVDLLAADIVYVKACLMQKSYQQAYPELYDQLGALLSTLECVMQQVKMSAEYNSQLFYSTNKTMISPKKIETKQTKIAEKKEAGESVLPNNTHDVCHNPLIQRMNPFHDFEVGQD